MKCDRDGDCHGEGGSVWYPVRQLCSIVLYQGIKGSRLALGWVSSGGRLVVTDVVGLAAVCRLQVAVRFQGGDRERKRSQARLLVV